MANNSRNLRNLIGCVKWFNTKSGYGFITVTTDGDKKGKDFFVHHSAINVKNEQYKYLVQGEYVEFDLEKLDNEKHEWQAVNVYGINGGQLMCETRLNNKLQKTQYRETTILSDVYPKQRQNQKQPVNKQLLKRKNVRAENVTNVKETDNRCKAPTPL